MRIFAIAPNPISATNKKQYNQNTFQGKIPKSANVADTFQKSVDKIAEEKRYTGRILLVGIGYDKETKEHRCQVEVVEQ